MGRRLGRSIQNFNFLIFPKDVDDDFTKQLREELKTNNMIEE
jgi:hypothetical protein